VGLLVYQNPLLPLMDVRNMLSVVFAATSIAVGLFGLQHLFLFVAHRIPQKRLVKS
jgi:hypothetical protein